MSPERKREAASLLLLFANDEDERMVGIWEKDRDYERCRARFLADELEADARKGENADTTTG